MTAITQWPALREIPESKEYKLLFERAIWGKVDGQRSDYRWIARSPGFKGDSCAVQRALTLGLEDKPCPLVLWHASEGSFYAVSCYPSRARDANGRSGFLEKQIIEWRPDGVPAAIGALTLLGIACGYTDEDWIARSRDPGWLRPDFSIGLDTMTVTVGNDTILAAISGGLRSLEGILEPAMTDFYTGLAHWISTPATAGPGHRAAPGLLETESQLGPAALAVLLLPFEENDAKRLSLAGGLPVSQVEEEDLKSWSGVVCRSRAIVRGASEAAGDASERKRANAIVTALRRHEPPPRTEFLLEFAASDERWLDASSLPAPGELNASEIGLVHDAIKVVNNEAALPTGLPESLQKARVEHLRAKADVIRAAASAISPKQFHFPEATKWIRSTLQKWGK